MLYSLEERIRYRFSLTNRAIIIMILLVVIVYRLLFFIFCLILFLQTKPMAQALDSLELHVDTITSSSLSSSSPSIFPPSSSELTVTDSASGPSGSSKIQTEMLSDEIMENAEPLNENPA